MSLKLFSDRIVFADGSEQATAGASEQVFYNSISITNYDVADVDLSISEEDFLSSLAIRLNGTLVNDINVYITNIQDRIIFVDDNADHAGFTIKFWMNDA